MPVMNPTDAAINGGVSCGSARSAVGSELSSGQFLRIDSDGIDAGDTGLHLRLAEVNTRFKIDEMFGEELSRFSPVQPKLVGCKTHQCGPHSEVDPAVDFE